MGKQILRSIVFLALGFLMSTSLCAQVPQSFNYQLVVRDANDHLVRNQSIGLRLFIETVRNDTTTTVYVETQTVPTDYNGYLSIEVGRGNVVSGVFADIPWADYDTIQLYTQVDLEGGTNYTLAARQQLVAVPYAFLANESQHLGNVVERGNFAGMRQLKDVKDPTDPQDVLTKYHLDSVIAEYARRMSAETRDTNACITPGATLTWRGEDYDHQGVYRHTIEGVGSHGVDSVIVLHLLVNNGTLGNVRVWQKLFYEKRYSHTTLDFGPDWAKLADAYGVGYYKANNNDEFDAEFKKAFESHKPCIVDARVDIDEMILPMAIPGKPIDEQMMSWDN